MQDKQDPLTIDLVLADIPGRDEQEIVNHIVEGTPFTLRLAFGSASIDMIPKKMIESMVKEAFLSSSADMVPKKMVQALLEAARDVVKCHTPGRDEVMDGFVHHLARLIGEE